MSLLAFGEVLWDIYPDQKFIGGAPLNFAAHFKRCGGKSVMVSCVGNDNLGIETISEIKHFGVNTEYIAINSEKPTGICNVTLNEVSVPIYNLLEDVSYDYIPTENIENNFDVLYFGTLALRSAYNLNSLNSLISRHNYKEIFVDINIRPPYYSKETVLFALNHATLLKISDEELPTVADVIDISYLSIDDFWQSIKSLFPKIKLIVTTLGANGSKVFDCKTEKCYFCPAKKVKVVSTVGAGDSFGAAFLYNYLCNKSIDICLKSATEVSAFVVSHKSAVPIAN